MILGMHTSLSFNKNGLFNNFHFTSTIKYDCWLWYNSTAARNSNIKNYQWKIDHFFDNFSELFKVDIRQFFWSLFWLIKTLLLFQKQTRLQKALEGINWTPEEKDKYKLIGNTAIFIMFIRRWFGEWKRRWRKWRHRPWKAIDILLETKNSVFVKIGKQT